jgi:arylsulfatase A-like enzyme/Tfp pilus assembly protein PilF
MAEGVDAGTPIILISIDTLRSDRLPAYGYSRVDTPAIDHLRDDSVLFERAYTHMGLTLPSHTSILSGVRPIDNGVRDNVGYTVPDELVLLPEQLQEAGYKTGGFVSTYVLRKETNINQGFDVYDDEILFETGKQLGGLQRNGRDTLGRALAWLDGIGDVPFFLFFHIYEPHSPYEAPEPFRSRYSDIYDAEVATADAIVGDLLAALRESGLYDKALIVLLSDHGEGLMDHGEMDHLIFVYREVLQVPLLLKLPGNAGGGSAIAIPAQLTDVATTLRQLANLPEPNEAAAGLPLLGLTEADRERKIFSESQYPRIHFGWSDLASIIQDRYQYIEAPRPELYDLIADPASKNNLADTQIEVTSELRRAVAAIDRTLTGPGHVDAETAEQLASLGYVSGGAGATRTGPLPDPKDRLTVLGTMSIADGHLRKQEYLKAAVAFDQLTQIEPGMTYAWQQLAHSYQLAGQPEASIAPYQKAIELSGGSASVWQSLGEAYFELGELGKAEEAGKNATEQLPSANELLAKVALRRDRLADAQRYLDIAIENRGSKLSPLITRVGLLNKQGKYDEALEYSREVEEIFGQRQDRHVLHSLFYQRGTAFGHLGRFDEAKQAYREAIDLSSDSVASYSALAFILALEGDAQGAAETLRTMVEVNPNPFAYAQTVITLRQMQDPGSAQALLKQARQRWPSSEALARL